MRKRTPVSAISLIVSLVLLVPAGAWPTMAQNQPVLPDKAEDKIEAGLLAELAAKGTADFVMRFAEQADLSPAYAMDWQARGHFVYDTLKEVAQRSQTQARDYLLGRGLAHHSFIAGNELYVWAGDLAAARALAGLPEVAAIRAPRTFYIDSTTLMAGATHMGDAPQQPEVAWGILDSGAHPFWQEFGLQGDGIVVATIDTGVQYDHPGLDQAYRCWPDPSDPACWEDPSQSCGGSMCDTLGHGTSVMGIMVADDDAALPYTAGMAPNAQWITCLGCPSNCPDFDLNTCADWLLAPDGDPANRPHVVNNSWGGGGCDNWYQAKVQAWQAAGIFPAFSAGVSGPNCDTSSSPGDYQESFASTYHDVSRNIGSFASRGPSCFGHDPYTKPNASAPGVDIVSTILGDTWGNVGNGSSWSTAHTAGAVALLWSCNPDLNGQVNATFEALQNTADPPPAGDCGAPPDAEGNYTYGYGYLNIYATGLAHCPQIPGDDYEVDDTCAAANAIPTDGTVQTHDFHDENDQDWAKFNAQAGNTYVIRVDNVGDNVDAVLVLYDECDAPPLEEVDDAFGTTVELEWNCEADGEYYVGVLQHDGSVYGEGTNYDLSVSVDADPPSPPASLWATPANQMLIVQWQPSPEDDVAGYRVWWGTASGPPYSGVAPVDGKTNTYHEITNLTNGLLYYVALQAVDFTGNVSDYSLEIGATPSDVADATQPSVAIDRPSADPEHTTTVGSVTVGGDCTDAGNNLSRVRVHNQTNGAEGWDYSLSGGSASFNVESIPLAVGDNQIQVMVYDGADNTATDSLTIHRVGNVSGAAVIVGGHNNSNSLQTNINYATNRAYRVFRDSGYSADDIYYLSPGPQDADGDGADDVDATTTPANVHAALQWAAGQVGSGTPFYLYLMDHGGVEKFCADGCSVGGHIKSEDLDTWLDELEASSGCDQVNVIIEACHSGSFIDRVEGVAKSISKDGRVVIASTDRDHNAYASVQGAYFSDAFFSAVAESSSLLASFNRAKTAVGTTGRSQTPWLDDNGDGLSNSSDGTYAASRYVAGFFGTLLPEITSASISISGGAGTISAQVERGDEPLDVVWAAVYAPSFQEPTTTTLDLGVPLIALEPDLQQEGVYSAYYNNFGEAGAYQVVVYAEDRVGNQALPWLANTMKIYLPLVLKHSG